MSKGLTRWYPRSVAPVRVGMYDCGVRIAPGVVVLRRLEWDGIGFLVPFTMTVVQWRGLTKKEYEASL